MVKIKGFDTELMNLSIHSYDALVTETLKSWNVYYYGSVMH